MSRSDGEREWIWEEVVTMSGPAAAVGFRLAGDVVEVWHWDAVCAVFDRGRLRSWLARMPAKALDVDGVAVSVDHSLDDRGRVAITLPDVRSWSLSPGTQAELRARV